MPPYHVEHNPPHHLNVHVLRFPLCLFPKPRALSLASKVIGIRNADADFSPYFAKTESEIGFCELFDGPARDTSESLFDKAEILILSAMNEACQFPVNKRKGN